MQLTNQDNWFSKLRLLPGKLSYRLRQEGYLGTAGWLLHQVTWRFQEYRLGIETQPSAESSEEDDGENHCYEPINTKCFYDILQNLDLKPGVDVFFDCGCGKGRALILAALHPFKSVIGLERSEELANIARQNAAHVQAKSQCPIVIMQGSAEQSEFPDDATVLFMFNPFSGSILLKFLDRVKESLSSEPRPFTLIYVVPKNVINELECIDWLTQTKEIQPGYMTEDRCLFYAAHLSKTQDDGMVFHGN